MLRWVGALLLLVPGSLWADEFKEANFVKAERGQVTFEADGTTHQFYVAPTIKGYDDTGKLIEGPFVARLLMPGNVLAIKTGKVTGKEMITEIKLVKGKLAEMAVKGNVPKPNEAPLSKLPGRVGNIEWEGYYKNARVGDFIVFQGRSADEPPGRKEITETGKDYVVYFHVFYLFGHPDASRTRLEHQDDGKKATTPGDKPAKTSPSKSSSKKSSSKSSSSNEPAAKKTEQLTIAGKTITCEIEEKKLDKGATHRKWTSNDVPFGGLVKEEIRGKVTFLLVDFGLGEK